jgi:hypothetical protein
MIYQWIRPSVFFCLCADVDRLRRPLWQQLRTTLRELDGLGKGKLGLPEEQT